MQTLRKLPTKAPSKAKKTVSMISTILKYACFSRDSQIGGEFRVSGLEINLLRTIFSGKR